MPRLAVLIALLALLVGVPSVVVARGAPQPMHLYQNQVSTSWPLWGYLIEHQSNWQTMGCPQPSGNQPEDCDGYWVVNPDPANLIWNIDDTAIWQASGYLEAGESFSIAHETIIDWQRHQMYYITGGLGNNRPFRITVDVPGWEGSYSQDFSDSGSFCLFIPKSDGPLDPRMESIPGSNGGNGLGPEGLGLRSDLIFTITNTGSHKSNGGGFGITAVYPNLSSQQNWCGGIVVTPVAGGFALVGP